MGQLCVFFFFSSRRRHTRFDCDWSSDVCSSDLIGAAAEVLEAAGAREIWAPLARTVTYRPGSKGARDEWLERVDAAGWGPNELLLVTFHQMASCRMGASARTSVVDSEHRVWGIRGLYVADASTVPSASGVNAMLTMIAIAYR